MLKKGYQIVFRDKQGILDFSKVKLNYSLPQGYSFEVSEQCDVKKLNDMTW